MKIEWEGVDAARPPGAFGLATATNVAIPEELYATVGPQVRAWEARAPMLTSSAAAARHGDGNAAWGLLRHGSARLLRCMEQRAGRRSACAGYRATYCATAYAGEASEERIGRNA